MIQLHRLHGAGSIVINADLIETIEACPDTTITLMTKRKLVVADPLDEVIEKVVAFRQRVNAAAASDLVVPGTAPGAVAPDSTQPTNVEEAA